MNVWPTLSDRRLSGRHSKQLCAGLRAEELAELRRDPAIYVTHFKPREAEIIMEQIAVRIPECRTRMFKQNQLPEFRVRLRRPAPQPLLQQREQ